MAGPDTTSLEVEVASRRERRCLLVFAAEGTRAVDLPARGALVIGRDPEADVVIDDDSVSRRHAELRVNDGRLAVRDLGSHNGTLVGGSPAREPTPVEAGMPVQIGRVMLVVVDPAGPRGSVPHAELEARLHARVAQARAHGGGAALFLVGAGAVAAPALATALGPSALVGEWSPGHLLATVPVDPARRGAELAASVRAALRAAGVDGEVGAAVFPRDAGSAAALVGAAMAALRPAPAAAAAAEPVADDPAMRAALDMAARFARGRIPVLIVGETGSGKEVVADAIHRGSPRRQGPLIKVNCAAFPESLLEGELFGHEKGAFTGAAAARIGLFEAADGGTLLLDEVGDLPLAQQAKLLRALEDGAVRRLGSVQERRVDTRVVAATHRDLEASVRAGTFRQDLYFRLSGAIVRVPPLRERPADVRALARRFAVDHGVILGDGVDEVLADYPWPGNVRELRNAIERAALLGDHGVIEAEHLPDQVLMAPRAGAEDDRAWAAVAAGTRDLERALIVDALEACAGNQTRAAERLGVSRRTLVAKIAGLEIPRSTGRR